VTNTYVHGLYFRNNLFIRYAHSQENGKRKNLNQHQLTLAMLEVLDRKIIQELSTIPISIKRCHCRNTDYWADDTLVGYTKQQAEVSP